MLLNYGLISEAELAEADFFLPGEFLPPIIMHPQVGSMAVIIMGRVRTNTPAGKGTHKHSCWRTKYIIPLHACKVDA